MANLAHDNTSWVIDSGAICHVVIRRDFYSSYTSRDYGVIRIGNARLSMIVDIREVCLKFNIGMELVLHNVKHVHNG